MRRVSIAMLSFALAFGILSTWLGPKAISYWYRPPVPSGAAAAFNCVDAVDWAMGRLVLTQLWGTLAGAVLGIVIGILLRSRKPAAAATTTTASAPTAPKV